MDGPSNKRIIEQAFEGLARADAATFLDAMADEVTGKHIDEPPGKICDP